MNKLIVGAPFGNHISVPGVTSTAGTFTWRKRAGVYRRIWRILSTVRYYPRFKSWINQLGLPNPGILSIHKREVQGKILSIHGFNHQEWQLLVDVAKDLRPIALELNFSCPNVCQTYIQEALRAAEFALSFDGPVIAKLPPIRWMDFVRPLKACGIKYFHLCNTIRTPGGGMSGKILKPYSLWAVEEVKQTWGEEVIVIGGGGVTCVEDIQDYVDAGADHVAVASTLGNPLNIRKLPRWRDYMSCGSPT
jgi:dihydroorotate dehydrogenase